MGIQELVDHDGEPMEADRLTKFVIVGDHNQLPPVQPVEVSEKLRPILGSLFEYYVRHQQVPSHQLRVNYRSRPEIVGYTRHLGLYRGSDRGAPHRRAGLRAAAAPARGGGALAAEVLADDRAVTALIHEEQYEASVSPLEAGLVSRVVEAFFAQMRVNEAPAERRSGASTSASWPRTTRRGA